MIPQIELKRNLAKERQEATVYEGLDWVIVAFNNILNTLKSGEEYLVFMLGESLKEKTVIRFFQRYHRERIKKRIKVRLLSNIAFKNIVNRWHDYKNMKIRYTNQKLPVGTFIFQDYVMTVVWGERPTAFIIKSKKNYQFYKIFFEDIWKTAKP